MDPCRELAEAARALLDRLADENVTITSETFRAAFNVEKLAARILDAEQRTASDEPCARCGGDPFGHDWTCTGRRPASEPTAHFGTTAAHTFDPNCPLCAAPTDSGERYIGYRCDCGELFTDEAAYITHRETCGGAV